MYSQTSAHFPCFTLFVLQVAQGLRYLHSSKPAILHGDLKGRNILIDSRFRAKLCDFGLSTKQAKGISGTPFWLAPEYLRGETQYNATCDMYSVGIILYEIYSRKNPYEGEDFRDVMRKVCNRRLNKRPDLPATAPPKIADLMKKCWSPDPNYRPQAKELDMLLMDMNPQDFEPLTFEQQAGMSKKPTKDMLYEIFPRHIADALKKGEKVEPENHELVTVVFSDIVHCEYCMFSLYCVLLTGPSYLVYDSLSFFSTIQPRSYRHFERDYADEGLFDVGPSLPRL